MASKTSAKTLDQKLAKIHAGKYTSKDFILADAKDADMAFGTQAPQRGRTREEYLEDMKALSRQGVLDIMLTSASNGQRLVQERGLNSKITLACRANDSTDVWNQRGSSYPATPSMPFSSVNLKRVKKFADLVLYSITLNNDTAADRHTLEEFKKFRIEAAEVGIRYFLEVFNPNKPTNLKESDIPSFVNDHIIRNLAGVTVEERPIFLKIAYNGAKNLQELAGHDKSVVVGVLGGSAGTTRDALELLSRAEEAGGRVSLFGRKIQKAENQLELVRLMRKVLDKKATPEEAVREYHDTLKKQGIAAARSLKDDLQITEAVLRNE